MVSGKINPADIGIKSDRQLTRALDVVFETGYIPIDFSEDIFQSSVHSTR